MTSLGLPHDIFWKQFLVSKSKTSFVMKTLWYLSFFVLKGYDLEIIENVIQFDLISNFFSTMTNSYHVLHDVDHLFRKYYSIFQRRHQMHLLQSESCC